MLLTELKNYLSQVKIADIKTLSQYLRADPQAVKAMLQHWIQRGQVGLIEPTTGCSNPCGKCRPLCREVYSWLE